MGGQERGDHVLVFLRLARAGRVDQASARPDDGAKRSSISPAAGAPPDRSSVRRQRMSGSRRIVPSPEHGASTARSRRRRERRACAARSPGRCDTVRAGPAARCAEQPEPPRPDVGRDDDPVVARRRRHLRRLAAGRRAGVEHAFAGAAPRTRRRAATPRPGRRTRRCGPAASAADCRPSTISPSGANARRSVRTPCRLERVGQRVPASS